MTINEAIEYLRTANVDCHPSSRAGDALGVLLAEYKVAMKTIENIAPSMLQEMTNAADWEAVAVRCINLLKNRQKPGMDAAIAEFLAKLEADEKQQTKTQNENTDRPQG